MFWIISMQYLLVTSSCSPIKHKYPSVSHNSPSVRLGLKSSLVIGQKAQIGPNPFTPRGRADLVVWFCRLKNVCYDTARARANWVHPKWKAGSWPRGQLCHISLIKYSWIKYDILSELHPLDYVESKGSILDYATSVGLCYIFWVGLASWPEGLYIWENVKPPL